MHIKEEEGDARDSAIYGEKNTSNADVPRRILATPSAIAADSRPCPHYAHELVDAAVPRSTELWGDLFGNDEGSEASYLSKPEGELVSEIYVSEAPLVVLVLARIFQCLLRWVLGLDKAYGDSRADIANVQLLVKAAIDGQNALPVLTAKEDDFTCANGEVCDMLECPVLEMQGELAIVTCTKPELAVDEKSGLSATCAEEIVLTLERTDYEKQDDTRSMSDNESVVFAEGRKDVGASLFKAGRFRMAFECYSRVVGLFTYIE